MQNIFQKPLTQKILLVVLLSGIATVIYVSAATNIGTNISTDGSLSVTGTTTLSSMLNVNDINVALSNVSDVGLNISGSAGTGIYTTRPISMYRAGAGDEGYVYFGMTNNENGLVMNPGGSAIKGINWWGGSPASTFLYSDYLDGIGAHFDLKSTTGRGMELAMSNASQIGIDIAGTLGTGIKTTRPYEWRPASGSEPAIHLEPGTGFTNSNTGAIYFGNDIVSDGRGIMFDGIDGTGIGIYQYLGNWTGSGGTGIHQDFGGNSGGSVGLSMNMRSSASNVGLDIYGALGTGIQTTRPIKIASSSMSTSEYPLEIIPATNGYGLTFSGNLSGAYGLYFPGTITNSEAIIMDGNVTDSKILGVHGNVTSSDIMYVYGSLTDSVGLNFREWLDNSIGLDFHGTIYNGSKGIYMAQIDSHLAMSYGIYLADVRREAVGLYTALSDSATGIKTILNSASSTAIDISGTTGTGIKTTRPYMGVTTDTATSTAITFETDIPLTNTAAKLVSFNNATTTKSFIDIYGGYWIGDAQNTWGAYGDGYSFGSVRNIANGDLNYNGITAGVYADNTWQNYSYFDNYGDNTGWWYYQRYYNNPNFATFNVNTDTGGVRVQYRDNLATGHDMLSMYSGANSDQILRVTSYGQLLLTNHTSAPTLSIVNAAAKSTIVVGDETANDNGSCLKLRDSDDAGWTYCSVLDGSLTCSLTSCE